MNTVIETPSPFHDGELSLQDRFGTREKVARFASRAVRDTMPDEHRDFFAQLPFLMVGATDAAGQPWATILAGAPGFARSPDPARLDIVACLPEGDPLKDSLLPGVDIGILGIELPTRRRNRMSGRIAAVTASSLSVAVRQSFGNCPQYIRPRFVRPAMPRPRTGQRHQSRDFAPHVADILRRADTFFIATAAPGSGPERFLGADVSHRGGPPGFVRLEGARGFSIPDYRGNGFFNTLGNLQVNPRAGCLFPDFATGDMVLMTGRAWLETGEVTGPDDTGRRLYFRAEEVIHNLQALPFDIS